MKKAKKSIEQKRQFSTVFFLLGVKVIPNLKKPREIIEMFFDIEKLSENYNDLINGIDIDEMKAMFDLFNSYVYNNFLNYYVEEEFYNIHEKPLRQIVNLIENKLAINYLTQMNDEEYDDIYNELVNLINIERQKYSFFKKMSISISFNLYKNKPFLESDDEVYTKYKNLDAFIYKALIKKPDLSFFEDKNYWLYSEELNMSDFLKEIKHYINIRGFYLMNDNGESFIINQDLYVPEDVLLNYCNEVKVRKNKKLLPFKKKNCTIIDDEISRKELFDV